MDRILIRGGKPLNGTVQISGAKNAALPLMATCLLTDEPVVFENMPDLADITSMWRLLQCLGTESVHLAGAPNSLSLHCPDLMSATAPYDLVRKMRASVLVLCPLVARSGRARVSLPGGCAIGTRPINLHLDGLERMGARIELSAGYVDATAPDGLHGAEIEFPQPSVGATENLMMAAALADGQTTMSNAACEPEIVDLARCLIAMGARIEGAGSPEIRIDGVSRLSGCRHRVLSDRIEAGTYAMAAAMTGGRLEVENADISLLGTAVDSLKSAGVRLDTTADGFVADGSAGRPRGSDVMTAPFPGFATDLQAQYMALMCRASGAAMITETIFENRFMHVPELLRMGADITVHGSSALVRGVDELHGAPVMATDLRASVSLVLAGLAAKGETVINRVYHLDRGYERLEGKLETLGADVERI